MRSSRNTKGRVRQHRPGVTQAAACASRPEVGASRLQSPASRSPCQCKPPLLNEKLSVSAAPHIAAVTFQPGGPDWQARQWLVVFPASACPKHINTGATCRVLWGLPVQRRARQAPRRECLAGSNRQQRIPPPAQRRGRCVRHQAAAGQACQGGLLPRNLLQPQLIVGVCGTLRAMDHRPASSSAHASLLPPVPCRFIWYNFAQRLPPRG